MPPRFAYWTILIDGKPTAFRARDQQELMPTLAQLKRKNTDVEIKWFAQGKLWESPEAQRSAGRPAFTGEKRGGDWRPGGAHKDPRDRFKKKNRPERAWSEKDPATQRDRDKLGPPRGDRPWSGKPRGDKPGGFRPAGGAHNPEARRSSSGPRTREGGWSNKPPSGGKRPWSAKPGGEPRKRRDDEPPDRG